MQERRATNRSAPFRFPRAVARQLRPPAACPTPKHRASCRRTDWFHAQWLAVGIGILLLCAADALLTLTLISHGAVEINPLMDPLVRGSGHSFGYWKIGLTAMGVLVLTLLARVRFWGRAVGTILYVVLGAYAVARGLRAISFT